MTSKIIYPKPLPVLIKQNLPLETGFTPTEIVALQNGWRLIKRRLKYHSGKIFVEFFSENYLLLEKFRDAMTEKFDLNHLHQHPYKLMNVYEKLIESGLNDAAYVNALLIEVGSRHKSFGVTYEDIKLKTDFINQYFNHLLEKIKSITFETGLTKLSELINEHHREKVEDEDSTHEEEDNDIFN